MTKDKAVVHTRERDETQEEVAAEPQPSRVSEEKDLAPAEEGEPVGTILAGFEPLFDAAGVIKCRC